MEKDNDFLRLLLLNPNSLKNKTNVEKVSLEYLPFSTGFEIECNKKNTFDLTAFEKIENIMDVNIDNREQRFRIPNGYKGFLCLYDISKELINNSELNPLSGIHYHVDFTDTFDDIRADTRILDSIKEQILTELDTWGYDGSYNHRDISTSFSYIRMNSDFKTFEFRIGEMTFDYSLLAKRIIHCNQLSLLIKNAYRFGIVQVAKLDKEEITEILTNRVINLY